MIMKKMLFWSFIGLFVLSVFTVCEQEVPPEEEWTWGGTTWERRDSEGNIVDTITLGERTLEYQNLAREKETVRYSLASSDNDCPATVDPGEAIRDWLVIDDDPDPYLAIIYSTYTSLNDQDKAEFTDADTPKLWILHPILYVKLAGDHPYVYTLKE
jgi:hypothetical protein